MFDVPLLVLKGIDFTGNMFSFFPRISSFVSLGSAISETSSVRFTTSLPASPCPNGSLKPRRRSSGLAKQQKAERSVVQFRDMCGFVCVFVCLPVCLPACLPACLFVCLSVCRFLWLSVCLSVCWLVGWLVGWLFPNA